MSGTSSAPRQLDIAGMSPRAVVVCAGLANLLYGTYSPSLARRATRPLPLLLALIPANVLWARAFTRNAMAVAQSRRHRTQRRWRGHP